MTDPEEMTTERLRALSADPARLQKALRDGAVIPNTPEHGSGQPTITGTPAEITQKLRAGEYSDLLTNKKEAN